MTAAERLPATEPLEWKTSVPSPYPYPDLPIERRLVLAATGDDPDSLSGWGDDGYHEIRGLIGEVEHLMMVAAANAMGLVGDWDTDDVEAAVTEALHEHRGLRAALVEARAEVERLTAQRASVLAALNAADEDPVAAAGFVRQAADAFAAKVAALEAAAMTAAADDRRDPAATRRLLADHRALARQQDAEIADLRSRLAAAEQERDRLCDLATNALGREPDALDLGDTDAWPHVRRCPG